MSGRPNRREGAAPTHAANRREGAAPTTPRRPASQTCLPLWERRPRRDLPALVGAPPPARSLRREGAAPTVSGFRRSAAPGAIGSAFVSPGLPA